MTEAFQLSMYVEGLDFFSQPVHRHSFFECLSPPLNHVYSLFLRIGHTFFLGE